MMGELKEAYVALGGNIGDALSNLQKALEKLKETPGIFDLKVSSFYKTTPVSDLKQDSYINAVCSFKTSFSALELLDVLQQIENDLGKLKKPKNFPRKIDLDLLFFGKMQFKSSTLEVPHPRWQERLFVLVPLADLTDEIDLPDGKKNINDLIKNFLNTNNEIVSFM